MTVQHSLIPEAGGATYTEAFRHACEVRYCVAMSSNDERKRYLEGVEKRRGRTAADRIRRDVWRAMRERSSAGVC